MSTFYGSNDLLERTNLFELRVCQCVSAAVRIRVLCIFGIGFSCDDHSITLICLGTRGQSLREDWIAYICREILRVRVLCTLCCTLSYY